MEHTIQKMHLFHAGDEGYDLYRNPAIATLGDGTVIMFTEARKDEPDNPHGSDWAASGIASRISRDGGKSWEPVYWVDTNGHGPTHNPTPIADINNPHTLHFLYQKDYRQVFYTRTDDSGRTWSPVRDITEFFYPIRSEYDWKVVGTGIGHGIMLKSGRLLTPLWYANNPADPMDHRPSRAGAVYSDDNGETWHCGALIPDVLKNPSEAQAAELADGRVMMNLRTEESSHRRAILYSDDGGETWGMPMMHPTLWEPICCAAFCRVPAENGKTLVFTNPDSQEAYENLKTRIESFTWNRHHLTARLSEDDGISWPYKRVIEPGISGYSDVTALADGTIISVYGCGTTNGQPFWKEYLDAAIYDADWVRGK